MDSTNLQACDRCHRRKTRCDKRRPECLACGKANATCTYSARPKAPVYRQDYVDRLERRARQLEDNNRVLEEQLSLTSQIPSPASHIHGVVNLAQSDTTSQHGTSESVQEAANEVSFLSTHAGGDRQYLGPASGMYLASLVKASTQQPTNARGVVNEARVSKEIAWSPDHKTLPPKQMVKSLIDAYLAHDALCYPIVHPIQVSVALEAVYAQSDSTTLEPFNGYLFNMLLAIATAQVYKFNWQVLPDAETHHQRAMAYFDAVLSAGGMQALQAMLLCCQFRLSSSTKDTSGSLWHMVGIASRMCFELGLHRESTYSLTHVYDRSDVTALLSISEVRKVWRQSFWCAFCLDRVVSITLGRPLAIHIEDIDVNLPSALLEDGAISPRSNTGADTLGIAPGYRMAVFRHIVRYRTLCGRILLSLHRGSRDTLPLPIDRTSTRDILAAELDAWRADTASLNLPEMDLSTPLAEARSSFRSKVWYELLYQNGVLLLCRPCPTNAGPGSEIDVDGVRSIHAAAKQSITLYAYLFRSRKINFSWITLHAVFLAGLSYIYAVSQHLREMRKSGDQDPRMLQGRLLPRNRQYLLKHHTALVTQQLTTTHSNYHGHCQRYTSMFECFSGCIRAV
jgi:hypothetical protein